MKEFNRADSLLDRERPKMRRKMERLKGRARDPPPQEEVCPAMVGDRPETLCGHSIQDVKDGKREIAVRCDGGGSWMHCAIYNERGPLV